MHLAGTLEKYPESQRFLPCSAHDRASSAGQDDHSSCLRERKAERRFARTLEKRSLAQNHHAHGFA